MSICKGRARRARTAISAERLSWAFASRKPSATSAPAWANASEIARPSPRAAPVTSATWPLRSKVGKSMECPFELGMLRVFSLSQRAPDHCHISAKTHGYIFGNNVARQDRSCGQPGSVPYQGCDEGAMGVEEVAGAAGAGCGSLCFGGAFSLAKICLMIFAVRRWLIWHAGS